MLGNTEKENINSQIPSTSANTDAELKNQYTLKINIESILWLKDLLDNTITISFCNPIYQKFYTIPNPVIIRLNELTYLENITCRMELEIPAEKILNFFAKWSPTIIICNKENKVLTHCDLDLNKFKLKSARERFFVTKTLYDKKTGREKLADINIILSIYDNKIKVSSPDNTYIGIPIFFQITEQLEIWKQNQKLIFQQQEKERMDALMKQWNKEKAKLEEKIVKNLHETNNVLQEIKNERDFVKAAIEIEFNKPNIDLVESKIDTKKKSTAPIKKTGAKQKNTKEQSEIQELKSIIKKQTEDIQQLKERTCQPSPHFQYIVELTDKLQAQIHLKQQEIEYLKQQWAKSTRELNSYKKYEKSIEAKHVATHNAMLPFMIQELLTLDSTEQKSDLEQLHSIRKELAEHKQENAKYTQEPGKSTELDTLLQTRTYNKRDKVVKILEHKKK